MNHSDYPALYKSASDLSQTSQKFFFRALLCHVGLLATACAISVINSSCALVAVVQSIVLLGALGCAIYLSVARPDRNWYTGRAVAESIKTITWRYISKAEPFDQADETDRHKFGTKLKAIVDQNKDVAGLLVTHLAGLQISEEMERLRQQPVSERHQYYRARRITDQQNWYAKKALTNRRWVDHFFIGLLSCIGIAILFSIAKVWYPTVPFWPTDFFVTVAAGLMSWIQAKRFQELSVSYALAAHEISLIREQAVASMTDQELSKFIGDAENAFSREHTQWIARKDN